MMEKYVATLGFFDSMHQGHIKVVNKCVELAKQFDAKPLLITFDDGFLAALSHKETKVIYTLNERRKLYKKYGINEIIVLESTPKLLSQSIEEFHGFLSEFNLVGIVVGEDFSYGQMASGNVETLKNYGKLENTPIFVVDFAKINGEKISSSSARKLILAGEIEKANELIGRDFSIEGEVIHGRGEGHLYGIPTANISVPNHKILPSEGVYATISELAGKSYPSVTNIGSQPTFGSDRLAVETLIIGFDGNIYGEKITLIFKEKLRNISKFDSVDELKGQITKDIERTVAKYGGQN